MNNFTLLPNEMDEETVGQISAEVLDRAKKLKRDFENQYQHQPTHRTPDLPPPAEIPQMAQQVLPTAPTIPPPTPEEEQDTFCDQVRVRDLEDLVNSLRVTLGMAVSLTRLTR